MLAFGRAAPGAEAAFNASYPVPDPGALRSWYSPVPANASCALLIAVAFSSVNPSDRNPLVAATDHFPKPLGSDLSGVVAAVASTGPRCTRLKVGDAVWGDSA